MSHDAYRQTLRATAAPREAEYEVFARATSGLMAIEKADGPDLKARIDAVHFNRTLWGALASDCANHRNQLPADLRRTIIRLAAWVGDYSSEAMRRRESLQPLIDVNRIIMNGLGGQSVVGADPASAPGER